MTVWDILYKPTPSDLWKQEPRAYSVIDKNAVVKALTNAYPLVEIDVIKRNVKG